MNWFKKIQAQIALVSPETIEERAAVLGEKYRGRFYDDGTPMTAELEDKRKKRAAMTTAELVDEIHDTFYSEVDRLLDQAMHPHSLDTDQEELIEKAKRLKKLGFTSASEVKEGTAEIDRIAELERKNREKKNLIESILYFSQKYPQYKFITEESVMMICEKYGLVYGGVDRYIGTIPDKNIEQMENFKISKEDEAHIIKTEFSYSAPMYQYCHEDKPFKRDYDSYYNTTKYKCPLEIVAPVSDFNMKKYELKNFKISEIHVPDPIVLQPVLHNGTRHYLIVTAWGPEASDPEVVNERMN